MPGSLRRRLGRSPRVVMTAVEHVARREMCRRRAQVSQAQPGVAAATERDGGLVRSAFGAQVTEHDPCPFVCAARSATAMPGLEVGAAGGVLLAEATPCWRLVPRRSYLRLTRTARD